MTWRVLAICYPQLLPHCSRDKYRIVLSLNCGFWCSSHCQLHSFGNCVLCFLMQLLRLVLGVVGVGGSISPLFAGPSFFKHQRRFRLGRGLLAGLPWIPPSYARALPCSTNFVGTNAQAHLLVMSLNVAKCNLGKVNLEAMLVSCFPSYIRGGPMSLAGAPRDLYTQLLACSSSQSVVAIACCLHAILYFGFFPIPTSLPPS